MSRPVAARAEGTGGARHLRAQQPENSAATGQAALLRWPLESGRGRARPLPGGGGVAGEAVARGLEEGGFGQVRVGQPRRTRVVQLAIQVLRS